MRKYFNKKFFVSVIKFVVKYVVPLVLGWIEGDTKVISDAVSNFISIY